MVVNDIRPSDEPADERRILADIGIFEPMNTAGHKLGHKNRSDEFQ